jgi:hypothetical protein
MLLLLYIFCIMLVKRLHMFMPVLKAACFYLRMKFFNKFIPLIATPESNLLLPNNVTDAQICRIPGIVGRPVSGLKNGVWQRKIGEIRNVVKS